jgi:hypothetical protein
MATRAELERLLGHALMAEKEFRKALCADPRKAADELGISLTDDQVDMLQHVSKRRLDGMARSASHLLVRPLTSSWKEPA